MLNLEGSRRVLGEREGGKRRKHVDVQERVGVPHPGDVLGHVRRAPERVVKFVALPGSAARRVQSNFHVAPNVELEVDDLHVGLGDDRESE